MRNSTKIVIVLIVLANLLMLSSCSDNHEHIYEERRIIKNATCSIEGIYEYKCVKCDHIKQEAIPKKELKDAGMK